MTQQAQHDTESALTPEVRAMIGVEGEVVESWGYVDQEYLRRFTQAVMDPRPAVLGQGVRRGNQVRRRHRTADHGQLHGGAAPARAGGPDNAGLQGEPRVRRHRQCGAPGRPATCADEPGAGAERRE